MFVSTELKQYIHQALERGGSKDEIRTVLEQAGWSPQVIRKILEQYTGVDANGLPIPAPRMQAHQFARDLFLYLLIFVTLSMIAFALGGLLFSLIDKVLPDPAFTNYRAYQDRIPWSIAQLVIAFPVFTLLTRLINRDITDHTEKRESLLRKLMIYLILAITAVVSLGDLVAVLTRFLEGELTLRYFSQSSVVLVISLLIFSYYLYEVRQDDRVLKEAQAPGHE